MGFLSRLRSAAFGDEDADINRKLRPPPLLGVLFCLISTFCFIVSIVSFRLGPTSLLMCLGLVIFYSAVGTAEGSAWERGYPSTALLVPIGIGTAALPLYIGIKIFVNIYAPYHLAVSGRKYQDVPPTGKVGEYADAGIIRFSQDATLDTSRAFGFKAEDYTYCVAPVVSREASIHPHSTGPRISFWAVGKDCCGNRRDFECDGAGETETKNAFTVNDLDKDMLMKFLVPRSSKNEYLKAIQGAIALHNLPPNSNEDDMVLVRWAAEPEKILEVWHNRAKVAVAISCGVYAVFITILWASVHFYFDSDIHKLAMGLKSGKIPLSRQVHDPFMLGTGA